MIDGLVVCSVEKDGNDPDENEDAAASVVGGSSVRMAVADGATEASFSDVWAQALVAAVVAFPKRGLWDLDVLATAHSQWLSGVPGPELLPWYAQEKLAAGSHAALAAVRLDRSERGYAWKARFVGDCQLFVLRPDRIRVLHRGAPARTAAEFGFHPVLIPTDASKWRLMPVIRAAGRLSPPFELWLTTDALAHSCLHAVENGGDPWAEWVEASDSPEAFRSLVDDKRARRTMRNDDVTLVRLWVG